MRFVERFSRRDPAKARLAENRLIHQVAALVLCYPDEALLEQVPLLREVIGGTSAAAEFAPALDHLDGAFEVPTSAPGGLEVRFPGERLLALQAYHVQEFDLSRRHALHLTYWTEGDTRRRGEVLAAVKQVYRDSGLLVDTGGELPDFLPMMLEFAAADPERGVALLSAHRPSLELLRLGLVDDAIPHAGVLAAICDTLPGPSPQTREEVQALVKAIAPVETVGLEPYGATFLGLPTLQRS
ncbi:MAG: nitrate reductase molybdenum cofactor assembly chaperone [Micropruina sp.]|nr:nitrate reductase molybdenum cofactor assembly chaperone [Micropruina sp.]